MNPLFPDETPAQPNRAAEAFAVGLVALLRRYGAPSYRLEAAMDVFTKRLGLQTEFHVFPASILASGPGGVVRLVNVAPADTDLDKLVATDKVAQDVASGVIDPREGLRRLRAIEADPGRIGPVAGALGASVAAGSAAVIFGGGLPEAGAAATIALLGFAISRVPSFSRNALGEVLAATAAALFVHAVPVGAQPALLGGLVAFYPGLRLTTGMTDLATGHLVSGSGGMLSAGVTLLQLGFGLALGTRLGTELFGAAQGISTAPPVWAEPTALIAGALAFAVILRAQRQHYAEIVLACAVAVGAERLAKDVLGPELAGGFAALCLTMVSNLLAHRREHPALLTLVPGIWFLVPGSLGFRAVQALLAEEVIVGVEAAFSTALAAMSLVAGTLLGNALLTPKRPL